CTSPSIPVTISPTGEIRGQGDLKCPFLMESQSHLRGLTTVTGRVASRKVTLSFSSSSTRGDFTVTLTEGSQTAAAGSPAVPSPDGLWHGTYACTAVSSAAKLPKFSIDLNLRIANGISSGGGVSGSSDNAGTLNIEVSVSPPNVTITRTYLLHWRTTLKS